MNTGEYTAESLAAKYNKGKNYIGNDRLKKIGFKSKRTKDGVYWSWAREDIEPPWDANVLDRTFVKTYKPR